MSQPKYRLQGVPKLGLSVDEIVEATGLSRAFLYNEWGQGRGPRRAKIGGRTVSTPEWIAEYLRENEIT